MAFFQASTQNQGVKESLLVNVLPNSVKVLRVSPMSFPSSTPSIVTSPPMQVYWNCSALTANKPQFLSDNR